MSNLRVLYNDADECVMREMLKQISLVEAMLLITKPELREVVRKDPRLVQTTIPETFRLFKGNSKGVLENPTAIFLGDHGNVFITENSKFRRLLARLHYPVEVTEVSKSLQQPNGVTYTVGVVFAADTGNRRIVYKALRPSVFLEPKKLKVNELKEALQERQVTVDQRVRKPDLIKALDKWIQNERKKSKCSNSECQ